MAKLANLKLDTNVHGSQLSNQVPEDVGDVDEVDKVSRLASGAHPLADHVPFRILNEGRQHAAALAAHSALKKEIS